MANGEETKQARCERLSECLDAYDVAVTEVLDVDAPTSTDLANLRTARNLAWLELAKPFERRAEVRDGYGERWAIFDDDDATTLILHTGKSSQLSVVVSGDHVEFIFIDSDMKRSSVVDWCSQSDDVRSLLRATMKAQEACDDR